MPCGRFAGRRLADRGGTVYASGSSTCNTGGLEGVKVELGRRNAQSPHYADDEPPAGQLFTAEKLLYQTMIARVSKDGKVKEMTQPVTTGNCASCHRPAAPGGRIYLNQRRRFGTKGSAS